MTGKSDVKFTGRTGRQSSFEQFGSRTRFSQPRLRGRFPRPLRLSRDPRPDQDSDGPALLGPRPGGSGSDPQRIRVVARGLSTRIHS